MTTPTDPIPEFKLGADRYSRREPVAKREAEASQGLDPETREVVETFEALYAELSSAEPQPAPAPAAETGEADDLLIDMPLDLERPSAPLRAVESRIPGNARDLVQAVPAPHPARPTTSEVDPALDIDDAFAMLHAAESKGRENAEREAIDREDAEDAAAARDAPVPVKRSSHRRAAQSAPDTTTVAPDWAGKARALWPKVVGAAAIALIVGTGLGYLAGSTSDPVAPQAKIPVTPQGGARLQFDYDLKDE